MTRRFRLGLGCFLILLALPLFRVATASTGGVRTVDITIHFSRFEPEHVDVAPGETVRFVVRNTDPIDHEFILGDRYVQTIHENGTELRHPPKPGEMSVPAGTTQVTTYTFPTTSEQLIFACHLPGHYAFGMHGTVTIGD
jgi:uncharacterized cupredoxin-like copper-binding protein